MISVSRRPAASTAASTGATIAFTAAVSVAVDDELRDSRAEAKAEIRKSMTCSESVDSVVWVAGTLVLFAVSACMRADQ